MEYFVAIAGEKVGPLTQYRLVEMLREGEVTPESKAWHQGLDGWQPIEEIRSMRSAVAALKTPEEPTQQCLVGDPTVLGDEKNSSETPEKHKKTVPVAMEVRPLVRFWARSLDYCLVYIAVLMLSDFEFTEIKPEFTIFDIIGRVSESGATLFGLILGRFDSTEVKQFGQLMFFSFTLWHVVEGLMLNFVGTTPGKALFGIRITTRSNSKVSPLNGIIRSFLVYILGVGLFYLPLITFAAMTLSFFRLMATGSTLWDSALRLEVKHPPLGVMRIILAIVAFATLMVLQNLNSIL